MSAEQLATDPAVRAAVFATVTHEEAERVVHSPAGKVWCDVVGDMVLGATLRGPEGASAMESFRAVRGYRPS